METKVEDSNLAYIGSSQDHAARKSAAEKDPEFAGAGQQVGLEIWRVENRRTKNDTPDFGVKRWAKEDYGEFYMGDSYIVMKTYLNDDGAKLHDIHFWLGAETSQDEKGVAAYKTVELDALLDDLPVQHRETQGNEGKLFQSYFDEIKYLQGGIASGFRHVEPEKYEPRLLEVRRTKKTVRATQKPTSAASMNKGDVYILVAGSDVYLWVGEEASPFEKSKAATLVHNIVASRNGKAKEKDVDGKFWEILAGSEDDVKSAEDGDIRPDDSDMDPAKCTLFRVSEESGSIEFKKEHEGSLSKDMLDDKDVFIIDAGIEVFVWVGKNATAREANSGFLLADRYLEDNEDRPNTVPITQIKQGQLNSVFDALFA